MPTELLDSSQKLTRKTLSCSLISVVGRVIEPYFASPSRVDKEALQAGELRPRCTASRPLTPVVVTPSALSA
ncbi:hypothetical protein VTH06DRAFT_6118 [Thermothelomyces fergusii]